MKVTAATWRRAGAAVIVFAALVRAMTVPATLPWWDIDPLVSGPVEVGLVPSMGFLLDALVWLGVAAIIGATWRLRERLHWMLGLLVIAGWYGVIFRGLLLQDRPYADISSDYPGDWNNWVLGSAWASAMVGAWALLHAARDARVRRLLTVVIAGAALMYVARGTYHVLVEQPDLVRQFAQDPEAALAQNGLTLGTPAALMYERRLRHPDATGWFVFSNVYGTHAAMALALFVALAVASWRRFRAGLVQNGEPVLFGLLAAFVAWGLWIAHSKGAMGALLVVVGIVALLAVKPMRAFMHRRGGLVTTAMMIGVLGVVVTRGMVGERIGELSLLFRWFYMQGAVGVMRMDPFFGVGPARFKEGYLLTRPALSPEEVSSPHSIFFDWLATLGVFGALWCAALVVLAIWIGRGLGRGVDDTEEPESSRAWLVGAGIAVAATAVSMWIESAALVGPRALLMVVALVAWVVVVRLGWDAAMTTWRVVRLGLLGAALVCLAHAQIEMTLTVTGSAALAMCVIALAASEGAGEVKAIGARAPGIVGLGVCALSVVLVGVKGVGSGMTWESELNRSAVRWHEIVSSGRLPEIPPVEFEPDVLSKKVGEVPPWNEPWARYAALHMISAEACARAGWQDSARQHLARAEVANLCQLEELSPAAAYARRARLYELALRLEMMSREVPEREIIEARRRIGQAWLLVASADPHSLSALVHAFDQFHRPGAESLEWSFDVAQAFAAARRALEVNQLRRLDPLTQLTEQKREELEAFVKAVEPIQPDEPRGRTYSYPETSLEADKPLILDWFPAGR